MDYNDEYTNKTATSDYDWSFGFAVIFIFAGVVGNVLVCLAVFLERRLQNVTNMFLVSLAMADLLVSVVVMPFGATSGFLGKKALMIAKYYYCHNLDHCQIVTTKVSKTIDL